jgi:hypothetical protein
MEQTAMKPLSVNALQPPTDSGKVKVYRFKRASEVEDDACCAEIYGTRQAIQRFQAELIEDSEMEVDRTELDGYGRYQQQITTTKNAGLASTR